MGVYVFVFSRRRIIHVKLLELVIFGGQGGEEEDEKVNFKVKSQSSLR